MRAQRVDAGLRRPRYHAQLEDHGLPAGEWVLVRGIKRYKVHECEDCGEPLAPGDRCDTCLTWAVKNARDHQWAQMSWANRQRIWDVLTIRNDKEQAA